MVRHNFVLAFRNLRTHYGYALINILGLSIALCFSLIILAWVKDEVNVDQFHLHNESLFKVMTNAQEGSNGIKTSDILPYPLIEVLQTEFDEVEYATGFHYTHDRTIHKGEKRFSAAGSFANFNIFEAFSFPLIEGTLIGAENELNGIYISESLADQYLGPNWQGNAVDKSITIEGSWEEKPFDYKILGVFQDAPVSSTLKFDFITNLRLLRANNEWLQQWGNAQLRIFVKLRPEVDLDLFGSKLSELLHDKYKVEAQSYFLHQFTKNYLHGRFIGGKSAGGRISYVRIFFIAALFLIIIACINFVNLATARSVTKTKEIGIRKVIGAGKSNLQFQFLTETALVTTLAIICALIIIVALSPSIDVLTEKQLTNQLNTSTFWIGVLLLGLITTFVAGWYPSVVIANLKIGNEVSKAPPKVNGLNIRKMLVIFQFSLAILLVSGSVVVKDQIDYIKTMNLGIDIGHIVSLPASKTLINKYQIFKDELLRQQDIVDVTTTSHQPLIADSQTSDISWPGKDPNQHVDISLLWTDHKFADVFHLKLIEGDYYRKQKGEEMQGIVINETASKMMGFENAVGESIDLWEERVTIIGVVQDFHNRKLQSKIEPMALLLDETFMSYFEIRTVPGNIQESIASIEAVQSKIAPGEPFTYSFLDDGFSKLYKSELLTGKLADYFALVALIISCLGLLGLATLLTEQKSREIGIRKVLGASIINVVVLLSRGFLLLVLLGLLISIPISWYIMRLWLDDFAYGINYNLSHVLLPTGIVILLSLTAVGLQSLRAAIANPIDVLRTE